MPSEFANPRRHREVAEDGAYTTYRYRNADVLKVSKCRSHIVLSDGGARSVSTKNAINDALREERLPLQVKQIAFQWAVQRTSSTLRTFHSSYFTEGMTIKLV